MYDEHVTMTAVPTIRRRLKNAVLTLGAVAAAATLAVVVSPGGGGRTIAAADPALGAGGEFHQLPPARIFDSREVALDLSPNGPKGAKPTGASSSVVFDVPVAGKGGLPPFEDADKDGFDDNVLAVVANVTVVAPTQAGHATIYPKGAAAGTSSVVNFQPGQTVANSAILRPGQNGMISVHLVTPFAAGTAHLVVDISGWYSTSGFDDRGARVVTVEPTRVYDSDVFPGETLRGAAKVPIVVRGATELDDENNNVVPDNANVVGVIVNLTGVNAFGRSMPTHMSLVPNDFNLADATKWPRTSNLNLVPGQTRANLAIVPVGPDGQIRLFNLQGEVRVVVDITGYLLKGADVNTRAGRVIPLVSPFRAFDTRESAFFDQPLGPARAEDFSFEAFVNDVKVNGDAVGAQSGLFGNLTAAGLERQYSWAPVRSHMTVYPTPTDGSTAPPNISNLNFAEGEAVPNLALLRYGGGTEEPNRIRFFNLAGYVDYLLDVYAIVLAD
jgi:hypothetical protein